MDETGRLQVLRPQPNMSQRCGWRLLVLSPQRIRGQAQHSIWATQESSLKQKYTHEIWVGKRKRERQRENEQETCTCRGLGFYHLMTGVNLGEEYSLLEVGFSWKQGFTLLFHIWSGVTGLFCQSSWAYMVCSGFLWLCFEILPGQASDFPDSQPWLLLYWPPGILLEPNQLPTLIVVQHCECTKCHWLVPFITVLMLWELHFKTNICWGQRHGVYLKVPGWLLYASHNTAF